MRFLIPATAPAELGEGRVIEKFLWLPQTIGGEVRWLETARIKQEARFFQDALPGGIGCVSLTSLTWVAIAWGD